MNHAALFSRLLEDEQFIAWVRESGNEDDIYWKNLIAKHPGKIDSIKKAKASLVELSRRQNLLPEDRNEQLRQRVLQSTQKKSLEEITALPPRPRKTMHAIRRAAAILLLVGVGGWATWSVLEQNNIIVYRTPYGEIKEFMLPDSSLVTLNANSTLKYKYEAKEGKREVWLSGEGFFDVRKKKVHTEGNDYQPASFLVHTDYISVQVLGTRFNVKQRGEKTQVVLEEGSIQLSVNEQEENLLMQPDELIEIQQQNGKISQHLVKAEDYSVWKEGLLRFEGAGLDEISRVLEENYNIEISFRDPEKSEQMQLRGVFPANNIDLLLEAIANVTRTSMHKQHEVVEYR